MKFKKSDSSHRRDNKLPPKGQSLLLQAQDDARGLLTGEMIAPADAASVVSKSSTSKKSSWTSAVFGAFGRSSNGASNSNANFGSGNGINGRNNDERSSKSKTKRPSGYTLSVTPKSRSESRARSRSTTPTGRSERSLGHNRTASTSSAYDTQALASSKLANSRSRRSSKPKTKSKPESIPTLPASSKDTDRFIAIAKENSKTMPESKNRIQSSSKAATNATYSQPGFEVSYQKDQDADASRLTTATATTSGSQTTATASSIQPASKTTDRTSPSHHQRKQDGYQTEQQCHSPAARAAAEALVASADGKCDDDFDDDFGQHDFDPNEEDSSDEDDDNDETDTEVTSSSAGPMSSSQESSSAFQFNLAAGNMRSASRNRTSDDDGGFEILTTRSSTSKLGSPKQVTATATLPTVCSTRSSMSKSRSPSSSIGSNSQQSTPASASILSQQTSTSSSLFPLDSPRKGGGDGKHRSNSVFSASTSPRNGSNKSADTQSAGSTLKQQSKLILSRPFGRSSLPNDVLPWTVEVSPAEWDNPEQRWKYQIHVTKRHPQAQLQQPPSPSSSVAVTWRSLENFAWLEHALNAEFQGGLVLPLLSIAVGMTDLEQVTHEVDANLLRDWLSDVLNGIRGQGELLLGQHHHRSIDLLRSEALEAFLYRNTAPLQKPGNLITSMVGDGLLLKQQELQNRHRDRQQQRHQKNNYRHNNSDYDDEEEEEERNCQNDAMCKPAPRSTTNRVSLSSPQSRQPPDEEESFVHSLMRAPLALLTDDLCVGMGCQQVAEDSPSTVGSSVSSPVGNGKKYDRFTCSSRALGTADTLDIQDSFIDGSTMSPMQSPLSTQQRQIQRSDDSTSMGSASQSPHAWKLAQSPTLIQAERELALSYRKMALSTMEKVQVLLEDEEYIGLSWKRFAIALSNLFSYEKEVENARLGDKKIHRDHMPYRKVKKTTVDQCLRALAQQKVDRSVPSLRLLRAMLTAYVADLSAVGPSVDAYLEGLSQMALFEAAFSPQAKQLERQQREDKSSKDGSYNTLSTSSQTNSVSGTSNRAGRNSNTSLFGNWQEHLRVFASAARQQKTSSNYDDIVRSNSTSSTDSTEEKTMPAPATKMQQKRGVEDRVLSNERLLRESLTTLCKCTTMRTARMAFAYFKSEVAQCALLRSAAGSLRTKIDLSNKDAVAQMISRHQIENKEDMKTELALAQRIVNLGNMKKYPLPGSAANVIDEAIEVDTDNQDPDRAMAQMRDNALQIARERVGRWNSELAMAIMKAVGVNDPNVRVEETTRELRMVRKYAIGLRENLNRCIEAIDLLKNAVLKGQRLARQDLEGSEQSTASAKIGDARKEFFAELATLFSGIFVEQNNVESPRYKQSVPASETLSKAGIKLNDPLGWNYLTPKSKGEVRCGGAARAYIELKGSQTERLLSSLSRLLNDYTQRVEVVESFVYMECVGVQLEKHFSKLRTDALAAFEKKTDITTAINIATRKRIPSLVDELKAKLDKIGSVVTHTSVKEAKEAHLESKSVKMELHELALRRLLRARETSTERVIDLLNFWMKEEENACISELTTLGETLESIENNFLQFVIVNK